MPYAPTNLYPRNITLERSHKPIFLGNIDNKDVIEDMQVELIDPKGTIQGVIYPKDKGYYFRSIENTSETWIKNNWEGSHNNLPLEGYYDNNLVIKTENVDISSGITQPDIKFNEITNIVFTCTEDYGRVTVFEVQMSGMIGEEPFSLNFLFERDSEYKSFLSHTAPRDLRDIVMLWKFKSWSTSSNINIKVEQMVGQIKYMYSKWSSYTDIPISGVFNTECSYKLQYTNKEGVYDYFINIFIEDIWENKQGKYIRKIYPNSKGDSLVPRDVSYTESLSNDLIEIFIKKGTDLSFYDLLNDFSWRFLLTGKNYDRFIYEGSIEKAVIDDEYYYYKIPAIVGCPNYLQDRKTGKYFKKSLTYPSFYWGDVCEVEQTYDSENNYSYKITLPSLLKWLGTFNIIEDVVIMLGVYDITSEITSLDPNSYTITFTSEKAYIVTGKSITQKIFLTIERIWDYLQLIDLTPETQLYFFVEEQEEQLTTISRIIPDSDLYSNSIEFDMVQLYTNEVYSVDNKYEQVDSFLFEYNVEANKNVLTIESQIIDRLREYQILIYKDNNLIHQSENIISNKLEYKYLEIEPNTVYRVQVKVKTSEGLQKILEKEITTTEDAFSEFTGKLIQKENYNKINIKDSFNLPQLIAPFYTVFDRYYSIWKDNKNLVYQKLKKSDDNYFIDYDIDKNKDFVYRASFSGQAFLNQDGEGNYPSVECTSNETKYTLTMSDSGFIIENGEETYYYNHDESKFFILVFYKDDDNKILLDVQNNRLQVDNEGWTDISDFTINSVTNQSDEVVTLELSSWKTEKTKPRNWIGTVLYGTKYNYTENSKNIYEADLDQVWYFNLDTQSGNIDFNTEHNIYNTLSNHPKVGISNTNYMSQSITTRLGYLNEDDMYVEDNGEKLNKFAEFVNTDVTKILRLPNGYLIPVDIQLTNNVSQLNLVGEPSTISFKWTQVADHKTCVLYGLESNEAGVRREEIEQKDLFWNEVS